MYAWTALILLCFLVDVGYNYVYYFFFSGENGEINRDSSKVSPGKKIFMYIKAANDLTLMVLIVWQTIVLTRMMSILGTLLAEEQGRLKIITMAFSFGYIGGGFFYLYETIDTDDCDAPLMCTSFKGLMTLCGVFTCFDAIPTALLYYQHSQ